MRPNRTSRSFRSRPRAVPPVASGEETEGIDGLGSMLELEGERGFLLWRTLRNVRLWAATPPERREGLFVEGAYEQRLADVLTLDLEPSLYEAFVGLAELLRVPHRADARLVATRCSALAAWAQREGMRITALELLHAAALACPEDPYFALQAGRQARDQARHELAEGWLTRAVVLARGRRDWEIYARSHVALGNMFTTRGAFPRARQHLRRAARRAERQGLREPQAMAHHDLFVVESETGRQQEALTEAAAAVRLYAAADPRRGRLAYDVAYNLVLQGYFRPALELLEALYPKAEPAIRPLALGAIARTAGAEGDERRFTAARELLASLSTEVRSGAAWANVALGAVSLRSWDAAEEAAEMALRLGRLRRENKTVAIAESLLEQVASRRAPAPTVPSAGPGTDRISRLTGELVGLLAGV